MLSLPDSRAKAWLVFGGGSVLFVLGVYLWLLPPGQLPFPLGSPYSDGAISHWPSAFFLRESVWRYGQWPLWNPNHMLGQPFAANPLNKVWYPPQWLVLVIPPTLHLNLMVYAHGIWLAYGVIVWAREEGLHAGAAALATLAFSLNAKLIAHLGAGHLDILYGLAWVPWLLWSAGRMIRAARLREAIVLGTILAMMMLADLRITFYMVPLCGIYAVSMYVLGDSQMRLKIGGWAVAAGVGGALTAVAWLPLLALAPLITRSQLSVGDAAVFSLPVRCLLGAVTDQICTGQEYTTYLTIPAVVLACLSLRRKDRQRMLLLWGAIAAAGLWSLGSNGPLFGWVVRVVPALSWFRVPSRAWFVVAVATSLLAGFGLDSLLRNKLSKRGRFASITLAFAGAIWVAGTHIALPQLPDESKSRLVLLGSLIFMTGVGIWLAGGGLASTRLISASGVTLLGGGVLVATLIVSVLRVDRSLIEGRPPETDDALEVSWIEKIHSSCGVVFSPSFDLIDPASASADLRTLHAVDPMQFLWSASAIAEAAGVPQEGYSITAPPIPSDTSDDVAAALNGSHPDMDLLASLGVTWVAARYRMREAALSPVQDIDGLYHLAGGVPDYVALDAVDRRLMPNPAGDNLLCAGSPNRMSRTFGDDFLPEEPVIVVFPQAWAPGWRAWVNGQTARTTPVGQVLLGVVTDGGPVHQVEVAYRPIADTLGIVVSGIAAIATMIVWILADRAGRHGE